MYCRHCGRKIDDDSQFCVYCGTAVNNPGQTADEDDYFSDPNDSYSQNGQQYNQQYNQQYYGPPPQYGPPPYGPGPGQGDNWSSAEKNTWGLLGFIFALISLFFGFSFITGILGLVFSIIGVRNRKKCTKWNGFATAGLILSILALVLWILIYVLFFLLEASMMP